MTPNVGMDINTQYIAYALTNGSDVISLGTIPFKGDGPWEPKANTRLQHVKHAVDALDSQGLAMTHDTVRLEEPVIGPGARASMLVGMFNGAVYGCLVALGYEDVRMIHPSTWKADLRAQLGVTTAISSKVHVVNALRDIPGLETRIKEWPKDVQQDLWDAVGIAMGGS